MYDLNGKGVFVAGHRGMVGSAIARRLASEGCTLLTADREKLDLLDQRAVQAWMDEEQPDVVIVAAAKVGGILANSRFPADFLYENLVIATNLIDAASRVRCEKLLFIAASSVYPPYAEQPLAEEALLTGPLEPTHEWDALAKIAGIKLCQAYRRQHDCDFISVVPTNLYGPGESFELASSHVLPALIRKAHEARLAGAPSMEIWGTGSPRREFVHVDDLADACVILLKTYSGEEPVNIGSGEDIAISELAELVKKATGFEGEIVRDLTKPDGPPRKLLSASKLRALGWKPSIPLEEGLRSTYRWFLEHAAEAPPSAPDLRN